MADLAARARLLDDTHAGTDRRHLFRLPDGVVYLDGNSLGALRAAARRRSPTSSHHQWGEQLIRAWNEADWWGAPERVGDRIGALVGAAPGQVVVHRLHLGQPVQGGRRGLPHAARAAASC